MDSLGEKAPHRDVVLFRHDGRMKRIKETSSLYDPLYYVLIFPNGETGGVKEFLFVINSH